MTSLPRIRIFLPQQMLELRDGHGRLLARYTVSTGARGAGEQRGSYQTPRGRHLIRARIGGGQPAGSVFVGRRPTGEIWSPALAEAHPSRDWILTRILWLSGRQPGFNRLGQVDTMRRYIYLHGTPPTSVLGEPGSHGCIRMADNDIIDLFERVPVGTPVDIVQYQLHNGDWQTLKDAACAVRYPVFVDEQQVPQHMEVDEFDPLATHLLATGPEGQPIGTGRLLPDGRIGRLAVLPGWRGRGVGQSLMDGLLDQARAQGLRELSLHAQVQARAFYEPYGFVAIDTPFLEAGILHQTMVLNDHA